MGTAASYLNRNRAMVTYFDTHSCYPFILLQSFDISSFSTILISFLSYYDPIHPQVKSSKKSLVKFVIDCTQPVDDKVLDVASFEKYLHDRIKVEGKTGGLSANNVVLTRDRTKLTVTSPESLGFSKRQLKYLSKRYLKKQQLRDYIRVVASSKNSYELKYFDYSGNDEEIEE